MDKTRLARGLGPALLVAITGASLAPAASGASDRRVVSSTAELSEALHHAHPGDLIDLAPGDYGAVLIQNTTFAAAVTIESQDPAHPAVIRRLVVANSEGLRFTHLELDASGGKDDNPFAVGASSHIAFDHLSVHGSLDGNAQDDVALMLIRGSKDISIRDSEFQQGLDAIGHLDNDGLTISGNVIHDIRNDAIRGGGSSNVTISNNRFSGFHPEPGDHDDAIQFWTTGTTTAAHDITITDNKISRGGGASAFQGIFLGNERSLPYQHVVIARNLVEGSGYNGIAVGIAEDVELTGNTVQPFGDQRAWIVLKNVKRVTASDNRSPEFGFPGVGRLEEKHDVKIFAVPPHE